MEDAIRAKDIISAVRESMREDGEELFDVRLVPATFQVYLHAADFEALEGMSPAIVEQAKRALVQDLARLNREAQRAPKLRAIVGKPRLPLSPARSDWDIRLFPDPDGEVQRGHLKLVSLMDVATEYGGSLTKRILTTRLDGRTHREEEAATSAPPLAVLEYTDDRGPKRFAMTKPAIVIGRGGEGYWVDLALQTSLDVSREHARLRWDETQGAFFIKDVSTLGTTLDGAPIPSSIEVVDGTKHDRNIEVPLPQRARIGLADVVFVEFRAGGQA